MRRRLLLILAILGSCAVASFAIPLAIATADSRTQEFTLGRESDIQRFAVLAEEYVRTGDPARMSELFARIEVVRRRSLAVEGGAPREVATGDVRVDLDSRTVTVAGTDVDLTSKEFSLLEILLENPGAAVSRQQLMDRVWGDAFVAVSRSLDVHIGTLRAKLDRPGLISTIRGFGYRWVC